jgi:hypothetical protein
VPFGVVPFGVVVGVGGVVVGGVVPSSNVRPAAVVGGVRGVGVALPPRLP